MTFLIGVLTGVLLVSGTLAVGAYIIDLRHERQAMARMLEEGPKTRWWS